MYEMKEEYLTGIQKIDEEHKRLFEIAEETYQLLNAEFVADKYDGIRNLLQELEEYTKTHFAHEEEYMESIQYKRMFTQKMQHQNFINKLEELDIDAIDGSNAEEQDVMVEDILKFLTDWLVHHILETDKLIAQP